VLCFPFLSCENEITSFVVVSRIESGSLFLTGGLLLVCYGLNSSEGFSIYCCPGRPTGRTAPCETFHLALSRVLCTSALYLFIDVQYLRMCMCVYV